ncbi:hypothetical protein BIV57_03610 [Mangrovactinospora gilvigrisea]|uniref:Secreted protein n=1 Tax=Mangrovactinospora gilvigrisea TaxID=1428644 RepID=A0A1J7BJS2_9ACTN|nr:hypothetical protein [Mangrovactinospora gilvigrisea]OIV38837.1 hypothetical protein BIV57_03610 [Mangrovactinospora gilvigrisea]
MKLARLLIAVPVVAAGIAAAARGLRHTVRSAVAAEFAAERDRESAEARAYWNEQRRRELEDEAGMPEQRIAVDDLLPLDADMDPEFAAALRHALEDIADSDLAGPAVPPAAAGTGPDAGPAGPGVPDPMRHPSNPAWVPNTPDQAWTERRLTELCAQGTPLADVRPGPLGTLDLYVFEDETTLCVIPGDREVTERLVDALRAGHAVRMLGGSTIAGSFALTFEIAAPDTPDAPAVYLLADRVVASAQ